MTGTLPTEIANLSKLREFSVTCPLCAEQEIPASLLALTNLEIVTLKQMQFRGTIPSEIGTLEQIGE